MNIFTKVKIFLKNDLDPANEITRLDLMLNILALILGIGLGMLLVLSGVVSPKPAQLKSESSESAAEAERYVNKEVRVRFETLHGLPVSRAAEVEKAQADWLAEFDQALQPSANATTRIILERHTDFGGNSLGDYRNRFRLSPEVCGWYKRSGVIAIVTAYHPIQEQSRTVCSAVAGNLAGFAKDMIPNEILYGKRNNNNNGEKP